MPLLLLLLHLSTVVCQLKEVNLVLLEQMERDPRHWPAITGWARRRIAEDYLLPLDYRLK